MSDIVVRPYEPQDQEQTWHVRAMTYNSGRPIPIEQQVYRTATPYVGELDGRIVGTFVIMDMTCTRGSRAAWKTGGIAGVAVLPEARQAGVGGAMMRWALRHMRENGYVLAALYAFRETYYRKFGYEVCGLRHKVTCPTSRLPKIEA
nr:GNAT family N-acetyltransferase [Fimbriimonadaceae bacterium]